MNTEKTPKPKTRSSSIFSKMDKVLSMDSVFREGLPVKYVPYIIYITVLGLVYIGNSHYSDRLTRETAKLKREVQDLRYDYTTLKEGYMFESKQSEVAKRAQSIGLLESENAPFKIEVEAREY